MMNGANFRYLKVPKNWPSRPEQWKNQASFRLGGTCRPSWDPCKRYSQLGHHGDLTPQNTNLRVSRKPVFWAFLWLGVGEFSGLGMLRAAPGPSPGTYRYMAGLRSSIWAYPRDRGTLNFLVNCSSIGRPSSLAACTLGCTSLH